MNENQGILKMYNEEEIKQLLNNNERLVYIDDGTDEIVARYEDLPDIIVDVNEKLGHTENLKVYDFDNQLLDKPILTTIGYFLDKCDPKVREDIIDRLVNLQTGVEQMKDYKVIDEDMLFDVRIAMDEEMER
ncbi:MAG TPA: hypothetical protein IAB56_02435 [Candidatus Scybalousia intestinigallinarum]|nr:hypothetical protein [Candidatus Scybalousia intestinigallinarum]